VELTIEEHAEAHRELYEKHGRWQDKVAWLSLAGKIGHEERLFEIARNSNLGNPTNYKHDPEMIEYLREIKMGDKNPMYGKAAPNRGVKRPGVGGRKKGSGWSEQERQERMTAREKHGYEYLKDSERARKISEATKGRTGSATGKTWFTNGDIETYAVECPEGFRAGRKPGRKSNKKGMRWYNDGTANKQFRDGEVPEGFTRGRISKKR
jgi:hypothetical protein